MFGNSLTPLFEALLPLLTHAAEDVLTPDAGKSGVMCVDVEC